MRFSVVDYLFAAYGTAVALAVMSPVIVKETMGMAFFNRYGLAVFIAGAAVVGSPLLVVPLLDAHGRTKKQEREEITTLRQLQQYNH